MKQTDEHAIVWVKDVSRFAWVREIHLTARNLLCGFDKVYGPSRAQFDPGGAVVGVAVDQHNRVVRLFALTREDRVFRRVPQGAVLTSSVRINEPSVFIGGEN